MKRTANHAKHANGFQRLPDKKYPGQSLGPDFIFVEL